MKRVKSSPARRVLIAGVEVDARKDSLHEVLSKLSESRHSVTAKPVPCHEGKGKFQNINAGLLDLDLEQFDWIILVDDDVECPEYFLDRFLYLAEAADLNICMPAHKFRSNQTFQLTVRHWASMVRTTHFVESGPITAFKRPIFRHIFPFPELKWAWGTDIDWSESARRLGYRIGVIDGTSIRHLRPVGGSYQIQFAIEEAERFLAARGITRRRKDILTTVQTLTSSGILEYARI